MTSQKKQRISCLMVTRDPDRFPMLEKSIECYLKQDFADRELVICCDGPGRYLALLKGYVQRLGRGDIRLFCLSGNRTLGEMRNISVELAKGHYVCQWDDDDLNHPERLTRQVNHMKDRGCTVSFLQDQLHYFYETGEMYWVNWKPNLIPGTILCRKDHLATNPYSCSAKGEDGEMRNHLRRNFDVAGLSGQGFLNVYTFHGRNTWHRGHHRAIHTTYDADYLRGREHIVRDNLGHYDLPAATLSYSRVEPGPGASNAGAQQPEPV